jgi:hypothetical protein
MKSNEFYQRNMPYTVAGHTAIPTPQLSILLTAEGIKELAKRTKKGDLVRITEWSDFTHDCNERKHYERITIIKKDKNNES